MTASEFIVLSGAVILNYNLAVYFADPTALVLLGSFKDVDNSGKSLQLWWERAALEGVWVVAGHGRPSSIRLPVVLDHFIQIRVRVAKGKA